MTRITISLLLALLVPMCAKGADTKFFRKAADRVWNTRPDLFDPHREIPDSIKEGTSAVIIGEYNYTKADYNAAAGETRSECEWFTRRLVKLLDSKAVEEFSKHEFGESAQLGLKFRKNLVESDQAFGARIHKPDGTVTDVDITKAFVIDEGKKGGKDKDASRIIDIPGLEPGDVLEYFTYQKSNAREFDPPAQRVRFLTDYPVLDVVVEGVFSPDLTVEVRGYNGVADLETGKGKSGYNTVWLRSGNLPVLTDKRFVNRIRQEPFYEFRILNNTSPYRFYPRSARGGGLYLNPPVGTIFNDIAFIVAGVDFESSSLPAKIRKVVKDFRKSNPEATQKQLLDATWAAANYVNLTDTKSGDVPDYVLALAVCDVIRKEKLAESADIAFITPVTDVPTDEIMHWNQPDFGVIAEGNIYLISSIGSYMPGELPAEYQGQMLASYPSEKSFNFKFTPPTLITTPASKAADNKISIYATVDLGDDHNAKVSNEVVCTGAGKGLSDGFITPEEWLGAQENYLGIKDTRKVILKTAETEQERNRNAEDFYSSIFAGPDFEITDVNVKSSGIVPASPDFSVTFDSDVKDIYTYAGDEIIVKAGLFAGDNKRIEGKQRERQTDIHFKSPYQDTYSIRINIPEGYEADDASIEALTRNVQTPVGIFATRAKKGDDGRSVTLDVRSRIQYPLMNISAWPHILELTDAMADFADAVIILKKK